MGIGKIIAFILILVFALILIKIIWSGTGFLTNLLQSFIRNPVGVLLGLGIAWIILIIAGYIFWLCMFIDALKERDTLWIVLFILSFFTGIFPGLMAILYYFIVYRGEERKK